MRSIRGRRKWQRERGRSRGGKGKGEKCFVCLGAPVGILISTRIPWVHMIFDAASLCRSVAVRALAVP